MVQYFDDICGMQDTRLYQVKGVDGVEWAVPYYKGQLRARLKDGRFQSLIVMGIDDATLIGGPPRMIEGQVADLRKTDAIIVDSIGAATRLAQREPDGNRPLRIGDTVEINHNRATEQDAKTVRRLRSRVVQAARDTRWTGVPA